MGEDYQQEAPFRGIRPTFRLYLFGGPWFPGFTSSSALGLAVPQGCRSGMIREFGDATVGSFVRTHFTALTLFRPRIWGSLP
jgi:hypothetical protein